jgi:hypothetical protein
MRTIRALTSSTALKDGDSSHGITRAVGSRVAAMPWCARGLTALPPHALRRFGAIQINHVQGASLVLADMFDYNASARNVGRFLPGLNAGASTQGRFW